jgi:hypothetical protein
VNSQSIDVSTLSDETKEALLAELLDTVPEERVHDILTLQLTAEQKVELCMHWVE